MTDTDLTQAPHAAQSKKTLALVLVVVVLMVVAVLAYINWQKTHLNPMSEDATITTEGVQIVSAVPGRINELLIEEGQYVEKGQLLLTLDPEVYELRVAQAKAELALAEALLDSKQRVVLAQSHNATITNEQIDRAQANLALAKQTQARLATLAPKGYVPKQQLDEATTVRRDAEISLRQALEQADAAQALVDNTDAELAMVEMRKAGLAMAERALRDTRLYAPHSGRVVGLNMMTGEHLMPEMSVFTLLSTEHWYAAAMYKETTLSTIQPGQCADVYVMSNPQVRIQGKVQSIGWGVTATDMIELPRQVPYVQKSMNWVRVAQRFPVRIQLEMTPELEPYVRKGVSATTIIHSGSQCE
ncbi:multidrug transporter subunit MdtN [Paenalcaligenes hominis]|uniref:Multidrug transporter subunit MdtN n=1 Tax=Paenalcaligenes hominis TaxID=643674 RepID=A0A1U9K0A2_9BURK|nr:multidrug transporter subunit MdtN [Paenalcaligenes hominis]AQS51475.1 multidrug transporter subunit MdtN [Paenalcaligenes hominis]